MDLEIPKINIHTMPMNLRLRTVKRRNYRNLSYVDNLLTKSMAVVTENPIISLTLAFLFYAAVILIFGLKLHVSSNYLVLIPLFFAGAGFGLKGGLSAGILALPCNLLLFQIIGHPEYSPESKLVAEISGILTGTIVGYLCDLFRKLNKEIMRRNETEVQLLQSLQERESLLAEVHHRVKNNLSLMKSLIDLQSRRSEDSAFKTGSQKLKARIQSLFMVHEKLYSGKNFSALGARDYVHDLTKYLLDNRKFPGERPVLHLAVKAFSLALETASPLGLIINELLDNSLTHGLQPGKKLHITVGLEREDTDIILSVEDNGPGFDPEKVEEGTLGLTLVKTLCRQLKGSGEFRKNDDEGMTFFLRFPFISSVENPQD